MKTHVLSDKDLQKAAKIIENGGTVAFPTETVYGLGSDALNPAAVKKVFIAKSRSFNKPLIVGVPNKDEVYKIAEVNKLAEKLIEEFFPGPLTVVLQKKQIIPDIVTASSCKVAVRMPKHEIPLSLMRMAKRPIVVPSANVSGRPSPTTYEHVLEDLGGKIDAVIVGKCNIGIESTIIDVTTKLPKVLRLGAVSVEELQSIVGDVQVETQSYFSQYGLSKPLYVFTGKNTIERIEKFIEKIEKDGLRVAVISKSKIDHANLIEIKNDFAINLLTALRKAEKKDVDIIVLEIPEIKYKEVIIDRLTRFAKVFRV